MPAQIMTARRARRTFCDTHPEKIRKSHDTSDQGPQTWLPVLFIGGEGSASLMAIHCTQSEDTCETTSQARCEGQQTPARTHTTTSCLVLDITETQLSAAGVPGVLWRIWRACLGSATLAVFQHCGCSVGTALALKRESWQSADQGPRAIALAPLSSPPLPPRLLSSPRLPLHPAGSTSTGSQYR